MAGGLLAGAAAVGVGAYAYHEHEKHKNGPPTWVEVEGRDNIPENAIEAGKDRDNNPIYIARARYENSLRTSGRVMLLHPFDISFLLFRGWKGLSHIQGRRSHWVRWQSRRGNGTFFALPRSPPCSELNFIISSVNSKFSSAIPARYVGLGAATS